LNTLQNPVKATLHKRNFDSLHNVVMRELL